MRGFSDAERARIRAGLREAGEELFARYGLQKTTIADLTDEVGVAPSTFYQFYDSKEALYLEILESHGEEIADRIIGGSFEAHDDPETAIRAFLTAIVEEIDTNPLVHQLVVGDDLDRLRGAMTDEEEAAFREQDVAYFRPYVERFAERGEIRGDPETVAHSLRALTLLTLHEEDIGPRYDAVLERLIDAVARGLTT